MGRAAAAAAGEIASRYPEALRRGAFVLAGPGNNGGDGWAIARALAAVGVDVAVHDAMGAGTADCEAEKALSAECGVRSAAAYARVRLFFKLQSIRATSSCNDELSATFCSVR